ncbi:MAG: amino acid racemase [Spirochaetes bacterium]|nr:amino acid racemase [Spirochaetota bacterium]
MKRIGIIGGLGPESTVDYYRGIIDAFRRTEAGSAVPEIILYSADVSRLLKMAESKQWNALTEWLLTMINALHKAGAQFAAIASNTTHIVFDEVKSGSPVPLLSIVEETCLKAGSLGLTTLGLLGTKFTMQSDFYQKPFREKGMSVVVPQDGEIQLIHDKLMSEIELGIIRESTRKELLAIVKRMIDEDSIEALILGCTELPMILDRDEYGIIFLNTTAIHIQSIVKYCTTQ